MGKRDVAYVYKRLEDYYDLLIDYPEVENPSKEQKGLVSFFSKEAIENLCRLFADNNRLGTLMNEQITDELKLKLNSRRWRMVQNIRTPRIVRLARKVLTR